MDNTIKSGKDVIDDFFAEILNVPHTDENSSNSLNYTVQGTYWTKHYKTQWTNSPKQN